MAAQRMIVSGLRDGEPLLIVPRQLVLHDRARPGLGPPPTGWRVTVDGDAPLDVEMRFAVPLERMGETVAGLHRQPGGQRRRRRVPRPSRASAPRSTCPRSSPTWGA